MSTNPTFAYHLFGIYILELGKFFRDKFTGFKVNISNSTALNCQVFFGTPRAAFRYYFGKYNGRILMPMINYHMIDIERLPVYEPAAVWLHSHDSYDSSTGLMQMMRAPGVFSLTYSINLWNNSFRERDYMIHAIYNAFPRGETHLIYFPDLTNNPETFLQMPHMMEMAVADETELEGLDVGDTRDQIKTSFTIKCTRAFVPYDSFDVTTVNAIEFDAIMNDSLGNVTTVDLNMSGALIPEIEVEATVNDVTTVP